MKQLLWLSILIALIGVPSIPMHAAEPTDRFVEIYFLIQAGDTAQSARDAGAAAGKYSAALKLLQDIKVSKPDWYPQIVDYRIKYCTQQLKVLGAPAAIPSVQKPVTVTPPSLPIPPAADAERLQQLNAELEKAQAQIHELQQAREELTAQFAKYREQVASLGSEGAKKVQDQLIELRTINTGLTAKLQEAQVAATKTAVMATELQQAQDSVRKLEASRADLSSQLQAALAKVAVTQTTPQVEELLKKNADLTTQLAAAQNKITELSARADTAAAPAAGEIQLRADLEKLQAENKTLRISRDEALARLAETERQLRSARASAVKNDELIAQLRRENTLMRELIQGQTAQVRKRNRDEEEPNTTELRNWHPRRRPPASAPTVSESAKEKLVATLSAPASEPAETKSKTVPAVPPAPVVPAAPAPPPEPPPSTPVTEATKEAAKEATTKSVEPVVSPETATLLNEAREALATKDFEAAAAKYEKVLSREPDNMRALANLAVIRYQQGKLDEAETILRKTIVTSPNDSGARSMMGVICYRNGKIEEAYNELTRAIALDPRNFEAHNYLGIVMNEKGWPAAAEQEIRRAIELNPRYADAHFNLAVMYARQKTPRYELSRYHYQKALDLGAARDEKLEALLKDAGSTAK